MWKRVKVGIVENGKKKTPQSVGGVRGKISDSVVRKFVVYI